MWVIPLEDTAELLNSKSQVTNKPPEIDGFAVLKTVQGKIFLLDSENVIVAESA